MMNFKLGGIALAHEAEFSSDIALRMQTIFAVTPLKILLD